MYKYMCMYTFSSSFLAAAFFFFLNPFPPRSYHEEWGVRVGCLTLGTLARIKVNDEGENVTDNT